MRGRPDGEARERSGKIAEAQETNERPVGEDQATSGLPVGGGLSVVM